MPKNTDKALILKLQEDGRASYNELADRLGLTSLTVAKRVRHLLESGTITIRAVPNPERFGMKANALITIKADRTKIDDICELLIDNFYVNLVQTVFGRSDILIIVYFPTWEMMHSFINEELSLMDGVQQIETHYIKDIKKRYERLFHLGNEGRKDLPLKDNDWKIIKELAKDGRINAKDLAEKLEMHISTVSKKVSSLINADYIKISAIPNPGKFGFTGNAFIVMTITATKIDQVCAELYDCPEVHLILTMIEGSEIIVGVQTAINVLLYDFIKKKISRIGDIHNTDTLISAEVKKRYYGWFLEEE